MTNNYIVTFDYNNTLSAHDFALSNELIEYVGSARDENRILVEHYKSELNIADFRKSLNDLIQKREDQLSERRGYSVMINSNVKRGSLKYSRNVNLPEDY